VDKIGLSEVIVALWVLNAGGEYTRAQGNTHRITVPLTPLTANGAPVYTGDDGIPGE
jgi:hypothetical protein